MNMRLQRSLVAWVVIFFCGVLTGYGDGKPFQFRVEADKVTTNLYMDLTVQVAPGHFIYADHFGVQSPMGNPLVIVSAPESERIFDSFSESEKDVYNKDFSFRLMSPGYTGGTVRIQVDYQGCSEDICFFPETFVWSFPPDADSVELPSQEIGASSETVDWLPVASEFSIMASLSGYMDGEEFLSFLSEAQQGGAVTGRELGNRNLWSAVIAIVLGGLALNLTPCVLPMIPVNLAIIGAGVQAGSRSRGFLLGGLYGLAIALTYGAIGLLAVLTGSTFGSFNNSLWFNLGIAIIFALLALAMFDVIHIDFTRFQPRGGKQARVGGFGPAFLMGIIAALLAGACVAPVVISVLVWSQDLYVKGVTTGLFLPFLLGLGMGLPWPFAGAGLSFLPKPGKWMVWVRNGFGVLIMLLAFYYGFVAYEIIALTHDNAHEESDHLVVQDSPDELIRLLQQAKAGGKTVLIDFSTVGCKSCLAMEKTTLRDPEVLKALEDYVFFTFFAVKVREPEVKAVLDFFDVRGFPTFVILESKE